MQYTAAHDNDLNALGVLVHGCQHAAEPEVLRNKFFGHFSTLFGQNDMTGVHENKDNYFNAIDRDNTHINTEHHMHLCHTHTYR